MARDRRLITKAEPPARLLRYDEADWAGVETNPVTGKPMQVRRRFQWSAARRDWVRAHVATRDEFDRLFFADDVTLSPGVNVVQVEYDVEAVLTGHPRWRSDWAHVRP